MAFCGVGRKCSIGSESALKFGEPGSGLAGGDARDRSITQFWEDPGSLDAGETTGSLATTGNMATLLCGQKSWLEPRK